MYALRDKERITRRMKSELYEKAKYIAEHDDVKTPKNCLVLFSISFLPTKENRHLLSHQNPFFLAKDLLGAVLRLNNLPPLRNTDRACTNSPAPKVSMT